MVALLGFLAAVGGWSLTSLNAYLWLLLALTVAVAIAVFIIDWVGLPAEAFQEEFLEISRRSDDPEYWDVSERVAGALGIGRPRLYVFHGHGEGGVCWDFLTYKGVAVEAIVAGSVGPSGLLECCLAHEMAHLKNRDHLMKQLAQSMANLSLALALLTIVSAVMSAIFCGMTPVCVRSFVTGVTLVAFDQLLMCRLLGWMFRQHEFAADALGVAVMGDALATANALMIMDLRLKGIERQMVEAGLELPRPQGPRSHPEMKERILALIGRKKP
jgi:hypothetical protein